MLPTTTEATMTDDKIDHRKVYARGFYDGVEAAQSGVNVLTHPAFKNQEGNVRIAKLEAKLLNLSAVTKRIFWAVPIEHGWTPSQVFGELKRTNKPVQDLRHVTHCLSDLASMGLVREEPRGVFQRVHIEKASDDKPSVQPMPTQSIEPPVTKPTLVPPAKPNPQKRASELANALRKLADDVDMLALEMDEAQERNNQELAQLQQLKSLLKGFV